MAVTKPAPVRPLLLAALSLAALDAAPAQANILTLPTQYFSAYRNLSATAGTPDSASFSFGTLLFDKFDPNFGTLTQVRVELISTVTGYVSVFAEATGSVQGSADLDIDLDVNVAGGAGSFSYNSTKKAECEESGFGSDCSGFSYFSDPFSGSISFSGAPLADFIGASATFGVELPGELDLEVTCDGFSSTVTRCDSGAQVVWASHNFSAPINRRGQVIVTYTYEPRAVPEPASLALFGVGLAGLALTRRRPAAKTG